MSSTTGQPTLGGTPSPLPDIPAAATLLALFGIAGLTHLTIFLRNRHHPNRTRRFIFSFLLFVFSCTRIAALSLRIAWARAPHDAKIAVAATVVTSAGVLILMIVNLVLARRVVRGLHPAVGWQRDVKWVFLGVLGSVIGVLVMVVASLVVSVTNGDAVARGRARDVLLFAGVYITVLAVLPALVVLVARAVPNRGERWPAEGFGKGSMGGKMALLVGASLLLTAGAGFRAGVNFAAAPGGLPQWYHSKAAFYCFNFGIELAVVWAYAVFRFDRRFYVPEGSSAPGHYSGNGQGAAQGVDAVGGQEEEGIELGVRAATSGESGITGDSRYKDPVRGERSAV
ncbi:hypothetical protein C8A01DRAFT_35834 [Parachaetomium inaequale]|uniref:Uncharacterized protein n=1 Tax=Parachaetomium inaequale TaxID=2588326 RepID=A0AAN6SS60_9PEZI|nr:hypothetical protein C8A01DRAFT_35834 [Parachaetomium inaequale]